MGQSKNQRLARKRAKRFNKRMAKEKVLVYGKRLVKKLHKMVSATP